MKHPAIACKIATSDTKRSTHRLFCTYGTLSDGEWSILRRAAFNAARRKASDNADHEVRIQRHIVETVTYVCLTPAHLLIYRCVTRLHTTSLYCCGHTDITGRPTAVLNHLPIETSFTGAPRGSPIPRTVALLHMHNRAYNCRPRDWTMKDQFDAVAENGFLTKVGYVERPTYKNLCTIFYRKIANVQ